MRELEAEIRGRLAAAGLEPTREIEIVEEIAQHLSAQYDELVASGATEEDATAAVMAELEDNEALARELRRSERRGARPRRRARRARSSTASRPTIR